MSPRPAAPGAHESLLNAARLEFTRHGLETARVEDVARRAGLSKGSFYLHFKSKDDAFAEILQRFLGVLEDQARRRSEAEVGCADRVGALRPGDFQRGGPRLEEALKVQLEADVELLELLWSHRGLFTTIDSAGASHRKLVDGFRQRMREHIVGSAVAKQGQGRLRPGVEAEAVADMILGAYESFSRRMGLLKEKPDLRAWARSLLLVVHQGAFGPPAPVAVKVRDPRVRNGASR